MTTPASPTPAPIEWANLMQAGRDLLGPMRAGRLPAHEHVRRAASNAYYAMFHAPAESNATALVGPSTNPTTATAWGRIYRGLDPTAARRALQSNLQDFSAPAQRFTRAPVDLQQIRHSDDYDPNAVFAASDGAMHLDRAESAILGLAQIAPEERLHIATLTPVRSRLRTTRLANYAKTSAPVVIDIYPTTLAFSANGERTTRVLGRPCTKNRLRTHFVPSRIYPFLRSRPTPVGT